jgi:hypothetical protein
MGDTKNDIAWKKLFKKYDISKRIATDGIYEIKSAELNEFREARLMTKFDYISQLPEIFADSNFSILPISRGSYVNDIQRLTPQARNSLKHHGTDYLY